MASRLLLVAHAETSGTRELVFGDRTVLSRPEHVSPLEERVSGWVCGPEPACEQTARRLGGEPEEWPGLAGADFGEWAGRALAEVAADDPDGLRSWTTDPEARPHGGESLADLVRRVGRCLDAYAWSPGLTVAVVAPLVARAAAVHALGAPPRVIFAVDVSPSGQVGLTRHGSVWRLRRLG